MSSDEQEVFRRLVAELRMLEGTAETLESRMNFVNTVLTELTYARMTLEGVEKEKPDAPLFVPIGGGSYIKTKLDSADKVLVGVGVGVAIERTTTEAKQTVQNRISEIERSRAALQQQMVQVVGRIQEDRDRLQELSTKLNQAEGSTGVQKAERRL